MEKFVFILFVRNKDLTYLGTWPWPLSRLVASVPVVFVAALRKSWRHGSHVEDDSALVGCTEVSPECVSHRCMPVPCCRLVPAHCPCRGSCQISDAGTVRRPGCGWTPCGCAVDQACLNLRILFRAFSLRMWI